MLGDNHAPMLALKAIHDLRETVLEVRKGHLLGRRHGQKYSHNYRLVGSATPAAESPGATMIT